MAARIFRFKFSNDIIYAVEDFCKKHHSLDKNEFKEEWSKWLDKNSKLIMEEKEKLNLLNYKGDFEKKLFTSARYYFSKKVQNINNDKDEDKSQRKYIKIASEIIETINLDIKNAIDSKDYKPSSGFQQFMKENDNKIKVEIQRLEREYELTGKEAIDKIKKTYKNRYNILSKTS